MELTEHEKKEYYAKWCFVAVVYKDDFQLTIEKERINFQKQEKRIVRGKKMETETNDQKTSSQFSLKLFPCYCEENG